jgi:hypothetical protein
MGAWHRLLPFHRLAALFFHRTAETEIAASGGLIYETLPLKR